jgi:hypothetical protein
MNFYFEPIQVECYSGYKANERPIAFIFQDRRLEILEILDHWYEGGIESDTPVVNYFKVKTDDKSVFILRYVVHSDEWSVRVYGSKGF